jgi:predicted nuclease of restriction endonuclease-like RecB superfamily
MLTADLLRVSLDKQGLLKPGFLDPASSRLRERAAAILEVYRDGIGRRRGALDAAVDGVLGDAVDHKVVRGLAKLVEDQCSYAVAAAVDPAALRRVAYRLAAERGPLASRALEGGRPTRDAVLAEAAAVLGLPSAEGLGEALHADHADRQTLVGVEVPDADWLLHRYNVSLVQSVLLRATEVKVLLEGPRPARLRALLRAAKFHQLLHVVQRTPLGWMLVLDGPASLFSQTTRYGMALARFLPALLHVETPWRLEARVAWSARGTRTLALDASLGLRAHTADVGSWTPSEVEALRARWDALDTGWEWIAEAHPLPVGPDSLVIPDVGFRRDGRVAWLEVLGYWRRASLAARLAALAAHGPRNLLLAVPRKLAAEKGASVPEGVLPFSEVLPTRELLRRLEAVAEVPAG